MPLAPAAVVTNIKDAVEPARLSQLFHSAQPPKAGLPKRAPFMKFRLTPARIALIAAALALLLAALSLAAPDPSPVTLEDVTAHSGIRFHTEASRDFP